MDNLNNGYDLQQGRLDDCTYTVQRDDIGYSVWVSSECSFLTRWFKTLPSVKKHLPVLVDMVKLQNQIETLRTKLPKEPG